VIEVNEKRQFGRAFATEFRQSRLRQARAAFGIAGYAVESAKDLLPTLRHALDLGGPALVAVPWDHGANEAARRRDELRASTGGGSLVRLPGGVACASLWT